MNIINLTPHAINLHQNGGIVAYQPSGIVARCTMNRTPVKGAIPLYNTQYGKVTDLPAPADNTFYIVSALVRLALPDRKDLINPADLVRDDSGQIIGCKSFDIN